ncbi:Pectinesterase/pectinesterase inhibitor PPE8B [Triticum urartu]|uniref:Pectinesterase n=1 Tax=Triticum urartu TaxID=4572 RepID=M8B421_TRIUA|nr:Pectinesterase/pectinesterase inhibitor PPE8B [Triticum urartu]
MALSTPQSRTSVPTRLRGPAAPTPTRHKDTPHATPSRGNHTSVQAALDAAPSERDGGRYVIYVKRGVYRETVEVKKKKWNVMLVGDGMGATVISGRLNYVDGYSTFRTATVAVVGKGFIARDMTFQNTAGPAKHQAVALRCDSDLSVFYRCAFEGHQDTLYAHSLRQFYRDCNIAGTVDFVFGNAAAVFQNCHLLARAPLPGQKNSVTAQGRFNASMNSGFAFQFCNVSAHDDLLRAQVNQTDKAVATQTFLGRPWKAYSRVVFMQSYIGTVVRPEGWLAWDDNQSTLGTLYYERVAGAAVYVAGEVDDGGGESPWDGLECCGRHRSHQRGAGDYTAPSVMPPRPNKPPLPWSSSKFRYIRSSWRPLPFSITTSQLIRR